MGQDDVEIADGGGMTGGLVPFSLYSLRHVRSLLIEHDLLWLLLFLAWDIATSSLLSLTRCLFPGPP